LKKVVLVYSGGMDSSVLLYDLIHQGYQVSTFSIFYGQKHQKELAVAKKFASLLSLQHKLADISNLSDIFGNTSLVANHCEIPDGHYEEESMKETVVPNRNMIFLSLATAWAISIGSNKIAYAAHSGDHAIYPDCRNEFADAMNEAIQLCDWNSVSLVRPFVGLSKAEIVRKGVELEVPLEQTWSCYKGLDVHCGQCGTCIERREAFYLAGVEDKTKYSSSAPSLKFLVANNWRV